MLVASIKLVLINDCLLVPATKGHGESSVPMNTFRKDRALSSNNRSKRGSFNSTGGDGDRMKRVATEGDKAYFCSFIIS